MTFARHDVDCRQERSRLGARPIRPHPDRPSPIDPARSTQPDRPSPIDPARSTQPDRPSPIDPARRPGVCLMAVTRSDYSLSQLEVLEAESIHMMREVAAEFERPVLLFSGGKDSIVMLALAERAFWPARIPFPVMHVDTGHNFTEVIEYRDRRVA